MTSFDVLIITTAHHPQDGRLIRHQACLERHGFKSHIHAIASSNRLQRFLISPIKAYKAIKHYKPKCILLPDPELHLLFPPLLRNQVAVISDIHEDYQQVQLDRTWIKFGLKYLVRSALKVTEKIRSRYSHCVITADINVYPHADFEITNFPHPSDLPPPTANSQAKDFIYVGDIRKSRGLAMMLDLTEEISGMNLHLVGPAKQIDLNQVIADRGLEHRVIWHGRKDYRSSWELAQSCLAGLCLLENTEAFRYAHPTKIWEYWAVGIPVLATPLPGQSQMIKKVGAGIAADYSQLKETIQEWIDSPLKAQNLGTKGRSHVHVGSTERDLRLPQAVRLSLDKFSRLSGT